ncbi:MAG: hypothetical protein O2960_01975 [Verrucomicrobia bacterium]|nr:hypothetical protein [Verrucomicrobiota bacterium]
MKRTYVWMSALALVAYAITWYSAHAQVGGAVIKLSKLPVHQVLDIYKLTTKVELVVSTNVKQATGSVTVNETTLTPEDTAHLIERALLRQAGVVLTRIDEKRVSVTFNDRLELPVAATK